MNTQAHLRSEAELGAAPGSPHFPEVFARRAKQERDFGVAINRRTRAGVRSEIYLDEIEPGEPKGADPQISCGLFCMAEADGFSSHNVKADSTANEKHP